MKILSTAISFYVDVLPFVGYSMTGFPDCLKEVRVKFHVIDALYNKGQLGLPVKTTTTRGVMTETTDEAGFAHLGPFIPGETVKVEVHKDGFDDVSQEFVAEEGVDFKMLGMNPTVSYREGLFIYTLSTFLMV